MTKQKSGIGEVTRVEHKAADGLFPRLSDVYGNNEFKQELEDIVLSVENSKIYTMMGAKAPRSFLLHGPPGTGKTFSVKAIANEISARTLPKYAAIMSYDIGSYGTAYINMGSKNLQTFFNTGEQLIREPDNNIEKVIYWFDEIDSLMSKRGGRQSPEDDKLLNTLMKNLQRMNDNQSGEYFFGATNFPDALDKAATRSGRIDRKIEFKMPDYKSRYQMFNGFLNAANERAQYKLFRNFDVTQLAEMSKGFSNSDIESVIDVAIDLKLKEELRTRPKGIIPAYWMGQSRLLDSLNKVKENVEYTTKRKIGFMRD